MVLAAQLSNIVRLSSAKQKKYKISMNTNFDDSELRWQVLNGDKLFLTVFKDGLRCKIQFLDDQRW